jgi:hypothetical protein
MGADWLATPEAISLFVLATAERQFPLGAAFFITMVHFPLRR